MSTPSPMKEEPAGSASDSILERESVGDFISIAVHDLREPLRAIRLGAQLLGAGGRAAADDNAVKGSRYIAEGADRIELLLQNIAEYCYEEGREAVVRETDLEMVLREARAQVAADIKNCGATITHEPLPVVLGDLSALTAALRALLSNACKFRSETPPLIHIAAVREGPNCLVSVSDNGQGFDPAYRERVFRPFERLNGRRYPGSGLGLTLAKRIIENQGGRIWAESRPGEGSTFRFTLPLAG